MSYDRSFIPLLLAAGACVVAGALSARRVVVLPPGADCEVSTDGDACSEPVEEEREVDSGADDQNGDQQPEDAWPTS